MSRLQLCAFVIKNVYNAFIDFQLAVATKHPCNQKALSMGVRVSVYVCVCGSILKLVS